MEKRLFVMQQIKITLKQPNVSFYMVQISTKKDEDNTIVHHYATEKNNK